MCLYFLVAQIQRFIGQLGTEADNERMREEMNELQHSTNEMAKSTNLLLKQLMNGPQSTGPDQRQQRIQQVCVFSFIHFPIRM
jgi:syntaxin 12/13